MPTTATIDATANPRLAKMPRRSSGETARRSATRNSARNTAATTNPATTAPEPQPSVGPWMTAYSSANRADADGDLAAEVERAAGRRRASRGRQQAHQRADPGQSRHDDERPAPGPVVRGESAEHRRDRPAEREQSGPERDEPGALAVAPGAGEDHRQRGGEQRRGADPGQRLAGPQQVDAVRGRRGELAQAQQHGAADQQALAAEQVAQDAEGEFQDADRQQERVRDPGQLGADRVQVLLEQAVEGRRDRDADLRQAHGQAAGYEGAEGQR